MSIYCIINADNLIINRIRYDSEPDIPHATYPDCQVIKSTGAEQIGWTYIDGAFLPPPMDPTSPPPPTFEQPTVAVLQAQVDTLTASLAQVMSTLQGITK